LLLILHVIFFPLVLICPHPSICFLCWSHSCIS
jgi:hypothetical protein